MYITLVTENDRGGYKYDPCDMQYKLTKHTYEKSFDNFDDAVAAAKATAKKTKEDVEIWTKSHVIKFPEPALEVVALVDETAKTS